MKCEFQYYPHVYKLQVRNLIPVHVLLAMKTHTRNDANFPTLHRVLGPLGSVCSEARRLLGCSFDFEVNKEFFRPAQIPIFVNHTAEFEGLSVRKRTVCTCRVNTEVYHRKYATDYKHSNLNVSHRVLYLSRNILDNV
jgi:hypothetical protein